MKLSTCIAWKEVRVIGFLSHRRGTKLHRNVDWRAVIPRRSLPCFSAPALKLNKWNRTTGIHTCHDHVFHVSTFNFQRPQKEDWKHWRVFAIVYE